MARFDVYGNPDPAERKTIPYFLDLQNQFLEGLQTRAAVPLWTPQAFRGRVRNLNPELKVEGNPVVMDTAAIAAIPTGELRRPVANLADQRLAIQNALDTLFGSY
ncbi:MAG TPA: CcdB family protein [Ramlibacter sp.]|uniref:CcdB family protein n=1 Tax=Ramlibacter sp. TaxID=1917967 RepID=UPI002D7E5708|nr:CcdB family protein [Ramlibacter sp.]HET8748881.1 CcdB family protein [Ramlibacter sp.]